MDTAPGIPQQVAYYLTLQVSWVVDNDPEGAALLNPILERLCAEAGISLEDARTMFRAARQCTVEEQDHV